MLKEDAALARAPLAPAVKLALPRGGTGRAVAVTYNRIGGLIEKAAAATDVPVAAALALWQVESGGASFTPGAAILRFEAHVFFRTWAKNEKRQTTYDLHFRHGGRAGVAGKPWQNHACRRRPSDPFRPFHGDQAKEYKALALGIDLSDEETAYRCASIGGPQLMMSGFAALGYASARAMFRAFQASERAHVLGLMDFCLAHDLARALRAGDWRAAAKGYNGAGNVEIYAPRLKAAHDAAAALGL